ncbi:MAG: hypothetical protein NVS2B7_15230 [Herpetosiphon sp.]
MRRVLFSFAALIGMLLVSPLASFAAPAELCFKDIPGITNCISGRFQEYWQQNGGLAVFGYPISPAVTEQTAEGPFRTQYFERNRFELHPDKARPYDVLLGRLGDDRLRQQSRDWHDFARTKPLEGCLFFEQTGHNVCDFEANLGFRSYWESHGLQDASLSRYDRSLALFGLPLSDFTVETNAAGDTVATQWFERARFEYHIDQPKEFKVLLGLLGNETRNPSPNSSIKLPTGPAVPQREIDCAGVQLGENALAVENCVRPGETLVITVLNFEPNQQIGYTINDQAGNAVAAAQTTQANANGLVSITISTANYNGVVLAAGNYTFVARNANGPTHQANAPFRVIP